MPAMSGVEWWFCRSAGWRAFAERVVLPWAVGRAPLEGEALEVGAGSGAMAAAALARHPRLRLTATDVDPAMVEAAAARLAAYGDRASARVVDAGRLPFADGTYDVVLTFLMLHHTLAPEAVLAEAARVLRPGGRLVGYDLLDTPVNRAVHRLDRSPYRLLTARALRAALGGMADVTVRPAFGGTVARFTARRVS